MRDIAFTLVMLGLLPLAVMRPFVGVLLWSWISFMNPHREVWGFATALPWAAIVLAATVAGCVMAREPKKFELNPLTALFLVLMACFTVTTLLGTGDPEVRWDRYDRAVKMIIGLLLTASLLTDRWRLHALVWLMVVSIGYYGVKGGIFTIITAGNHRIWGPPQTMIGDNNHLAAGMLVTLPLMNYLRLHSRHRLIRIGLMVAMGLTLLSVVGSYSRGALLGLLAASTVLWLRSRGKIVSGILIVVAVAGVIAFMPQSWFDRMNTLKTYEQDQSAASRLVLWEISWKLALSRPLVGTGFGGPYSQHVVDTVAPGGPARAVHSIWFELLGEHGFPTFFVWIGLTVVALVYSFRAMALARDHPEAAWAGDIGRMAQVSMAAYFVSGTFLSLSYWDFYWTLLLVVVMACRLAEREVAAKAALPAHGSAEGAMAAPPRWRTTMGAIRVVPRQTAG